MTNLGNNENMKSAEMEEGHFIRCKKHSNNIIRNVKKKILKKIIHLIAHVYI